MIALLGLALVAVFSVLMVLAYSVPDSVVQSRMPTSIHQLELEGHPYVPFVGLHSLMPDNFTDALMLNQAVGDPSVGPIRGAFGSYMTVTSPIIDHDPLEGLQASITGGGTKASYARYWHGYQVVLRPALAFLDYRALRFVNVIWLSLLVTLASVVVRYRLGLKAMLASLMALFAVGIVVVPISIQFSGVFNIMLLGVIAVSLRVTRDGRLARDLETFFILGAVTSFVDLLTAPLLTLGMPLTVLLISRMRSDSESRITRQWACAAKMAVSWAVGYAGIWASKWVLSSLMLGGGVFGEVAENIAYVLDGGEAGVTLSRIDTVIHNVTMLIPAFGWNTSSPMLWDVVLGTLLMPALAIAVALVVLARHRRSDGRAGRVLGLLPAMLLPFAWYMVVNNHSAQHYWMAYRSLATMLFAVIFSVLYLFDPAFLLALKSRIVARLRGDGGGAAT